MQQLKLARMGIYRSYARERYDEYGWYRKLFDEYGLPWEDVVDGDIRQGELNERFDVIILPPYMRSSVLVDGRPSDQIFPEQAGGIGEVGARELRAFVERGGTLIANDLTAHFAIEEFDLPVRDVVLGLGQSRNAGTGPQGAAQNVDREFVIPGSLINLIADTESPVNYGMTRDFAGMHFRNPVFEITGEGAEAVVSYPSTNPLISGWVIGPEHVYGRAAVVHSSVGRGHVFLYGIRPIFRMQARGTYKLLFNAIFYGSASPVPLG